MITQMNFDTPPEFVTSSEIEQRLQTVYTRLKLPEGRIELQSGIVSRGIYPIKTKPSIIAANTAKMIVDKIGTKNLDMLIYAGVCRDFLEPSTASMVCHHLKLGSNVQSFDLSNACLGVVDGIILAARLIEAGQIKKALIVSGENSGPLLTDTIDYLLKHDEITRQDIKKFVANFTIGSAGVAVVVEEKIFGMKGFELKTYSSMSNTESANLCQGGGNTESLMMETNSEELLKAGIDLAKKTYQVFQKNWECVPDKIITHQVGVAHQHQLYEAIGESVKKDFSTFQTWGNTGSAALPLTFMKAIFENQIQSGQHVALLGIGSGLHCSMVGGTYL